MSREISARLRDFTRRRLMMHLCRRRREVADVPPRELLAPPPRHQITPHDDAIAEFISRRRMPAMRMMP